MIGFCIAIPGTIGKALLNPVDNTDEKACPHSQTDLFTWSTLWTYSRGQKKVYVSFAEKGSVPFPLYGQPFRGTLFARSENGQLYGKSTVAKRKRNGSF